MINGRNYIHNDFTCKDASVVDYMLVPHEQLHLYKEFNVKRVFDLFEMSGCVGLYDPTRKLPDHNLLQCVIDLTDYMCVSKLAVDDHGDKPESVAFKKYDVSDIPDGFMQGEDTMALLQQCIQRIENIHAVQQDVDDAKCFVTQL